MDFCVIMCYHIKRYTISRWSIGFCFEPVELSIEKEYYTDENNLGNYGGRYWLSFWRRY